MAEELDWNKILKDFDNGIKKAEEISNQVKEERNYAQLYDLDFVTNEVNEYLKETGTNAVLLTEKEGDDNE